MRQLLGIDLGGSKIEVAILDEQGTILFRERRQTPAGNYRGTLDTIRELVMLADPGGALPVGLGTPGALSPATGRLRNSNSTCLNGQTLLEDLESLLKRRVRIANDADCFALSEATDGAASGAACVFGIILGTGTGGGIVINGQLLKGPNAIAGEWGHNPLPWPRPEEQPGQACYCGKSGCIETWLAGPSLERDFPGNMRAAEINEAADQGNPAAAQTLDRYLDRLARSLANVINLLDPEVIVLGGGLSNMRRLYRELPQRLPDYVFADTLRTKITAPLHGDSSGVRGAAWLWRSN